MRLGRTRGVVTSARIAGEGGTSMKHGKTLGELHSLAVRARLCPGRRVRIVAWGKEYSK